MDGYLKKGYEKAKKVIVKDWDWLTIVDGTEGGGKSVIAQQGAKEVDPTFNINRIVFTPNEFRNAIINGEKYQAIVYDEAYTGLSSRGTMTDINKILVAMLAEIRQKNLFIFIVMPTFFDLDRYVALWRSRGLIHVYIDKGYGRGYFAYYNRDKKKALYMTGKKFYDYRRPKPNFRGRFTNRYVVDEVEYRKRKLEALKQHEVEKLEKDEQKFNFAIKVLSNYASERQIALDLNSVGLAISKSTIHNILSDFKDSRAYAQLPNENNNKLNLNASENKNGSKKEDINDISIA